MSEDKTVSRRDQVKGMIEEGVYTKAEIASTLGITTAGVSSQMTYLRWMGNHIIYDLDADMADRILKMATEEEFQAWEADKASRSASTTKVSKKTPAEQTIALYKTIATQTKQKETWAEKAEEYSADSKADPDDEDLADNAAEAAANVILLSIKIKRNVAKLADLPSLEKAKAEIAEAGGEEPNGEVDEDELDKGVDDEFETPEGLNEEELM